MKLSQLTDLTATIPVDYRGLKFDITVYTERVSDKDVRAEAAARAGAEPVAPADLAPLKENASAKETKEWEERAAAWTEASRAYLTEIRAWQKRKGYELLAGIVSSWTILDEETNEPLPVSVEIIAQLGEVLPAFILQKIMEEVARPLKPNS